MFSMIIPVLNRAGMINRAIDSCLRQPYPDYEILVVDDGSTDGTADVVRSYDDPRVRLFRHDTNRGVCAARNTAVDQARGDWLVLLDSDFELLPDALGHLAALCDAAPADVGNVATMCTWDRGPDTPRPEPAADLLLEYPAFVRFIATLHISEWFNCIRRTVFSQVRFPSRRAYEGGFHLELARRFRFQLSRKRLVLIHTDATNRITLSAPAPAAARLLRDAADSAEETRAILLSHGDVLRREAPSLHTGMVVAAATNYLLAGKRSAALRLLAAEGVSPVRSFSMAGSVGLGLVSPAVLAWTKAHWAWLRWSG